MAERHARVECAARILIAVLVGLATSLIWLSTSDSAYDATSSVYVKTGPGDIATQVQRGMYQQNQAQSFASLARGSLVLDQAIKSSGVSISAAKLAHETSVQVLPQTVVLLITVEDPSPAHARALSTSIAAALVSLANTIEEQGSGGTSPLKLVAVDRPELPTSAATPDLPRIILLALLIGTLVALVLPLPAVRKRQRRLGEDRIPRDQAPRGWEADHA